MAQNSALREACSLGHSREALAGDYPAAQPGLRVPEPHLHGGKDTHRQ